MSVLTLNHDEFGHLSSYLCTQCGYGPEAADALVSAILHTNSRSYAERYNEAVGWHPTTRDVAVKRGHVRNPVRAIQALRILRKLDVNISVKLLLPAEADILLTMFEDVGLSFISETGPGGDLKRVMTRRRALGARALEPRAARLLRRGFERTTRRISREYPESATALAPTY